MAVALVLDIVGSRRHDDQRGLLAGTAERVATRLVAEGSAVSAGPTVGDELQVLYDDARLADVVRQLAVLRLSLQVDSPVARPVELRTGIGVGEVLAPDGPATGAAAAGQSGSAWWAARDALDAVSARRQGWPMLGWWVAGEDDRGLATLRAVLVALDTIANGFDEVDRWCALGLLEGRTAGELAEGQGVTASTMSSRLHGHGVYGWTRTLETLGAAA